MNAVRDSGWEDRTVLICPRCSTALMHRSRGDLARSILLAGSCGHPDPDETARVALDAPLAELWPPDTGHIGTRVRNALLRNGIRTAGDLAARTPGDLVAIRHFGVSCMHEVRSVLAAHGLTLSGEEPGAETGEAAP